MAHVVKLPGGGTAISLGPQTAEELQGMIDRRHQVVLDYCKKMGWSPDPEKLTIEQILEIRDQPEWKNAGKETN